MLSRVVGDRGSARELGNHSCIPRAPYVHQGTSTSPWPVSQTERQQWQHRIWSTNVSSAGIAHYMTYSFMIILSWRSRGSITEVCLGVPYLHDSIPMTSMLESFEEVKVCGAWIWATERHAGSTAWWMNTGPCGQITMVPATDAGMTRDLTEAWTAHLMPGQCRQRCQP